MPDEASATIPPLLSGRLLVAWAVLLGLAIVAGLGLGVQDADYPTPFLIANVYRLLVGAELFALLVAVPWVDAASLRRCSGQACRVAERLEAASTVDGGGGTAVGAGPRARPPRLQRAGLLGLLALWAMGLPAVVVAAWVADTDASAEWASQGYVALAAAFVAAYLRADRAGRGRPAYWLLVATLGGGAPILAFLVGDLMRADLGCLYAFSPFWVGDRLSQSAAFGWDWVVPAGGLALLAGLLGCVPGGRGSCRAA